VLASITRFVERKLKLKVNEKESQVVPTSRCKFLGFYFHGKDLVWHADALSKFRRRVRQLTNRSQGKSMSRVIQELTTYLRGWINYFGVAKGYQKCVELDHWIRRRLRMCFWQQWRKPRTKVRNLLKLGVPLDLAVTCGASNKSYWRSSRTPGINMALSNDFLSNMGLYSLRDRWVELHYG
jgi:RNA-directed DNA polymerase